MSNTNKQVAEAVGKILVGLAFGFVINPLLLLCGLRFVLEAGGYNQIPYSPAAYFGVLLILIAIKLKVRAEE